MKYLNIIILCLIFFSYTGLKAEENDLPDEYTFNESETEKKMFEFGGYAEMYPVLSITDSESALYRMKYYKDDPGKTTLESSFNLQPEVKFEKGIFKAYTKAFGSVYYSEKEWNRDIKLYEGYATLMPNQNIIIDAGKKNLKWGKGYAWNPVAFTDRSKNPDDPEAAYEGFIIADADLIFNFDGYLKTISLTSAFIPVDDKINSEFGKVEGSNYAGKLYMLFMDTDIDLLFIKGNSRGDRYGLDFSRNISTSFEIHGEAAFMPEYVKRYLDNTGAVSEKEYTAKSYLAGIRYLTESETTYIIEYYHNGTGMSESEMQNYYSFIDNAENMYLSTGNETLFEKASDLTEGNYGKMNPMRNYLYLRISRKEPFDILYLTPAISFIGNVDDKSFTVTPEILYSGINNFELRLRYALLCGDDNTEYGEKPVDQKFDLRLRYYF